MLRRDGNGRCFFPADMLISCFGFTLRALTSLLPVPLSLLKVPTNINIRRVEICFKCNRGFHSFLGHWKIHIFKNMHLGSAKCSVLLQIKQLDWIGQYKCESFEVFPPIKCLFHHKVNKLSIRTGKFPRIWKCSKVTALFKSGELINPTNYLPISILPTLSKILESVIHSQLYECNLDSNSLLSKKQFGFRYCSLLLRKRTLRAAEQVECRSLQCNIVTKSEQTYF